MSKDNLATLARRTKDQPQLALIPIEPSWKDWWWDMPSLVMGDATPLYRITVNLFTLDDLKELAARLGVRLTPKSDSVTFPAEQLDAPKNWEYCDE